MGRASREGAAGLNCVDAFRSGAEPKAERGRALRSPARIGLAVPDSEVDAARASEFG